MKKDHSLLKKIRILEECNSAEQKIVEKYLQPLVIKKGNNIFRQNDIIRTLYIVKKGLVGSYTYLNDGSKMDIARYASGMAFGEMALAEAFPQTTTCYAVTDAELLVIDVVDFYRLIWTHPGLGVKILKAIMRYMILGLRDADKFLTTLALWGEKARHRAITDELTGLFNKRFFEESIESTIINSKKKRATFSLIMLDIDDFHHINESLGTMKADDILRKIARNIRSICAQNNIISRLGGDEFAVLLPDKSITSALQVAKKISLVLKKINVKPETIGNVRDSTITISASIGIAEYPDHGETVMAIKEAVDKALYCSKKTGKNKIMCAGEREEL